MAKSSGQITKIYELRTKGYDQLTKELRDIVKRFEDIRKAKLSTAVKQPAFAPQDVQGAQKYNAELIKMQLEHQRLVLEEQRLINEQKAVLLQRQASINQQRQAKTSNDAEAGSIFHIRQEIKELNNALIRKNQGGNSLVDFRGQKLSIEQTTARLRELISLDQDYRRQFQKDQVLIGEYTTGIINAYKKMGLGDLIGGQITKVQDKIKQLNGEFDKLQTELIHTKALGQGTSTIEQQMIENRIAVANLTQEVNRLNATGGGFDLGKQISTSIGNAFKSARTQLAQFVAGYLGFQAAFRGVVSSVSTAKELSDATTQLEVNLNLAAGGAAHLVDELAKLDTRTKLVGLEEIANIAVKAGVTEENLVKVVGAIDKIKVAFGEDFGSVEEGTESLVKLVNIFEGTDQVTGESLLRVGNAVRTLANETVASVPFLNDFSKRMAGLKGISNISLPAVLGLASGFEQFGQSSEVAGTALTKVIPALARDVDKFAKVAGVTKEQFSELINNSPEEALIKVAEGLTKTSGGLEEIAVRFADSELGAGRIAAILGTLGKKSEDFRKSISSAGKSYKDTGNIIDGFNAKNTNLAATLDKISKAFSDAANSKVFQAAINAIAVGVLFLINNLPTLITIIGLYTAGWALANRAIIIQNVQLGIQRIALPILTLLTGSATQAQIAYGNATLFASNAMARLTLLLRNPVFQVFALLITGIVVSVKAFGDGLNTVVGSVDRLVTSQRILNDVNKETAKEFDEVKAKELTLLTIIKDHTLAIGTRKEALEDLRKLGGGYLDQLTLESIETAEGTKQLGYFNEQLQKSIRLRALSAQKKAQEADLEKLYDAQFKISRAKLTGVVLPEDIPVDILEKTFGGQLGYEFDKLMGYVISAKTPLSIAQIKEIDKAVDKAIKEGVANLEGTDVVAEQFKREDIAAAAKELIKAQSLAAELAFDLEKIGKGEAGTPHFGETTDDYIAAAKKLADAKVDVERKRKAFLEAQGKPTTIPGAGDDKLEEEKDFTLKGLQDALANVEKEIDATIQLNIAEKEKQKKLDDLRKTRDELKARIRSLLGDKPKVPRPSRLEGPLQDEFKKLDASRDAELRDLEARLINEERFLQEELKTKTENIDKQISQVKKGSAEELSTLTELSRQKIDLEINTNQQIADARAKTPEQRTEDRLKFITDEYNINVNYIKQKMDLLDGSNAEELRVREAFNLEIIKLEEKANKEIFDIQSDRLKEEKERKIAAERVRLADIEADPSIDDVPKAQAHLDAFTKIREYQLQFNKDIDNLEKQLAQRSLTNAKERASAIAETEKELLKSPAKIGAAILKDIATKYGNDVSLINTTFEKARQAILDNDELTALQRERALERLAKIHKFTILSTEVEKLREEFAEIKRQYEAGLASEAAFLKKKEELEKAKGDKKQAGNELKTFTAISPSDATTQKIIADQLGKALATKKLRFEEGSAEAQLLGQAIAQSFDLAQEAMHNYFDAERERIRQSLEFTLQRLDLEKEQRIERAQSQAEIDSLEREYAAKRRTAERDAGEQLKKSKLAEAKIALATELANLAVAAASAGSKTGAAAPFVIPAIYAVLSGLAFARYAINVASISREKFERGGVPKRGGEFGGKPHSKGGTPFIYRDREYEAEVKELAIVRTKEVNRTKNYTITGTQMQVASAANVIGGGVDFAPGAKVKEEKKKPSIIARVKKKFALGGKLGADSQPPAVVEQEEFIKTTKQVYRRTMAELDVVSASHRRTEYKRFESGEITEETLQKNLTSINRSQAQRQVEINSRFLTTVEQQKSTILTQQQAYFNEKSAELKTRLDRQEISQETFEKNIATLENTRTQSQIATNKSYAAMVEELSVKQLITSVTENNRRYKVSGTQEQIVSTINTVNGGINFSPGGVIKFADGGQVPLRGGKFGGRTHDKGGTPFRFKGIEYEAEVDELAIIRTRDADKMKQYTMTGNFTQLASMLNELGGGKSFAKTPPSQKKFQTGGVLGDTLQAPIFTPASNSSSYISNTNNTADTQALRDDLKNYTQAIDRRFDRLKAYVVEKEMTSAQNKAANKASIGTL